MVGVSAERAASARMAATLSFPVMSVDGMFEPGPATLELGGDTLDVKLLDAELDALGDLAFFCR